MWGLDNAEPGVAIAAMQAMNASVRNPVFFPAFFLTPLVAAWAAVLALSGGRRAAAGLLGTACVVYLVGGLGLTLTGNVPMNEGLAAVPVPPDAGVAERVWSDYSSRWQVFNQIRTVASGASFLLATTGLLLLGGSPSRRTYGQRAPSDTKPAAARMARNNPKPA